MENTATSTDDDIKNIACQKYWLFGAFAGTMGTSELAS